MRWIIKKSLKYLLIVTVWLGFVVYTATNEFLMDTISAGLSRVANISTPHAKQKSDMARQRAAIQKTRAKSQKLATKMVKRNVLDVSSGLIPVGGVVIGLGLAAADVYAARELIDLHNELSETLELDEENSVGNKLCIDAVARVESLSDVSEVAASSKAEGLAPQKVIENYFEFFNNEDRASLNSSSGEPFVFIIGGKPTAYPKYGDAVDFDGMKASGWSYSRIHKNELVYQDDISAMVDINFSRYNDDDEVISTTDVVYLLVMRDGLWKVKGGFVDGSLTLGKD